MPAKLMSFSRSRRKIFKWRQKFLDKVDFESEIPGCPLGKNPFPSKLLLCFSTQFVIFSRKVPIAKKQQIINESSFQPGATQT
jgi:hypothetical protein